MHTHPHHNHAIKTKDNRVNMRVTTAILSLLLVQLQPPAMATRSLHEIPHNSYTQHRLGAGSERTTRRQTSSTGDV